MRPKELNTHNLENSRVTAAWPPLCYSSSLCLAAGVGASDGNKSRFREFQCLLLVISCHACTTQGGADDLTRRCSPEE